MKNINFKRFLPLIFTLAVIGLDQLTKALIVAYVPVNTIASSFFGDFLRIVHVNNTVVAFSIGYDWPQFLKLICFNILPIVVIILFLIYAIKTDEINNFQRWCIAGIAGGGIGNLIDRIFRSTGVVDFIDVKFYGLFGLERWPTFNFADSFVLVCAILLVISFIVSSLKIQKEQTPSEEKTSND